VLVSWAEFPLVTGVVAPGSKPVHALGDGSARAWDRMDTWDKSTLLDLN